MTAKHFDEGKPDLAQLPRAALEQMATVMMMGEKKYGRYNFMGGMDWTKLVSSTLRHCYKWLDGEDLDDESGQPHLAHAAVDLCMLMAIIQNQRGRDDRYKKPDPRVIEFLNAMKEINDVSNDSTEPAGEGTSVSWDQPGTAGRVHNCT